MYAQENYYMQGNLIGGSMPHGAAAMNAFNQLNPLMMGQQGNLVDM